MLFVSFKSLLLNQNLSTLNKFLFSFVFTFLFLNVFSQAPVGYYQSAKDKKGAELKTALHEIIRNHKRLSYGDLWRAYPTTDDRQNDSQTKTILWDMYSDNPNGDEYEFEFRTNQCGTYKRESDCYNREHSFPKSWWGGSKGTSMFTDIHHVIPTDGYVNSKRSNYPMGEVTENGIDFRSKNGSLRGTSAISIPNYSGKVFEPIDEYKGDIARIYFYMATRYENKIATWQYNSTYSDAVLDGTTYPVYEDWFIQLMLKWHKQDPPSQKEIERNNEIYSNVQHNRNPFIDHPEFAECIWANTCTTKVDDNHKPTSKKIFKQINKQSFLIFNPYARKMMIAITNEENTVKETFINRRNKQVYNVSHLKNGDYKVHTFLLGKPAQSFQFQKR